ncbi:uncharacterized protein LOC123429941 [Hordeum vulgare subsp. vulgare]|uniref:uncharacterized protein LOC123429941 n=1 Tax=Hordeum vulgare subsp. vulgare TaxID=112509 RepID=UPI001D1A490C|nr:uncharacterized protein LOC123429941 [Hordeum vulgare subsp. vulgare]
MVSAQYLGTEKPPPLLASDCVRVLANDAGFSCSPSAATAASSWTLPSASVSPSGARRILAKTSLVCVSAMYSTAATRQGTSAGTRAAERSAPASRPSACSAWPCGK